MVSLALLNPLAATGKTAQHQCTAWMLKGFCHWKKDVCTRMSCWCISIVENTSQNDNTAHLTEEREKENSNCAKFSFPVLISANELEPMQHIYALGFLRRVKLFLVVIQSQQQHPTKWACIWAKCCSKQVLLLKGCYVGALRSCHQ